MDDVSRSRRSDDRPVDALRMEQQQEIETVVLGTGGQWHGAAVGAFVGGVLGGLAMLVVALLAFSDTGGALVLLPAIGTAFGAVAGGVYEGGRNPEREGELETNDGDPDPSAAVKGNPPSANEH